MSGGCGLHESHLTPWPLGPTDHIVDGLQIKVGFALQ